MRLHRMWQKARLRLEWPTPARMHTRRLSPQLMTKDSLRTIDCSKCTHARAISQTDVLTTSFPSDGWIHTSTHTHTHSDTHQGIHAS